MDKLFNAGDVFKVKSRSTFDNNQSYGIAVPIATADGCYMLDTYMLDNKCLIKKVQWSKTVERINSLATDPERGKYAIQYAACNYYNSNYVKLDKRSMEQFYLWFNVNDYVQIDDSEACMYDESDVVERVKLFHEHCYMTNGCTAVKKSASKREILECYAKCKDVYENCRYVLQASSSLNADILEMRSWIAGLAGEYKRMDAESIPENDEKILVNCAKLVRECEILYCLAKDRERKIKKLKEESATWSFNCLSNVDTW